MIASEYSIQIYAHIITGGLIHLILAYEAPIPSASWYMCNMKITYCTMLGYLVKLNSTKTVFSWSISTMKSKIVVLKRNTCPIFFSTNCGNAAKKSEMKRMSFFYSILISLYVLVFYFLICNFYT